MREIVINKLGPKEQVGFIFAFKVDHEDIYYLQTKLSYTSQHFTEQLHKHFGHNEDIDPYSISSPTAQIDFVRKKVTQNQQKKYRFEAYLPFNVTKHVLLKNNRYILQIKVENASLNKVFPETMRFKSNKPDVFKVIDLNETTYANSPVFDTGEIRSLVFILEPKDPSQKINKFKPEQLG